MLDDPLMVQHEINLENTYNMLRYNSENEALVEAPRSKGIKRQEIFILCALSD